MSKIIIAITIAFFGILGAYISTPVYATTVTWTGLDDGSSWSHPNNWSTHSVPIGSDTIIIDGNTLVNSFVHLDNDFTLTGTLVLQQNDFLIVDSGKTLAIGTGGLIKNAGNLEPVGTITNSGTINNNATGNFENFGLVSNLSIINNTGQFYTGVSGLTNNLGTIFGPGDISNQGIMSNVGAIANNGSSLTNDGTLNNNSPGIITVTGFGTDGTVTNSGTINFVGPLGYQNYNSGTFTNSGTINNSGTIYNNAGDSFQTGFIHNTGIINNDGVLVNRIRNTTFQTVNGIITNEAAGVINNNKNLAMVNPGTIDNGGTINNLGALNNYCHGIYNNYDPGLKNAGNGVIYYNQITTIPCTSSTINITSVSNSSPRWSIDSVSVSGNVTGTSSGDTVTISWGDGTTSTANAITGTSWGPVIHSYASSAIGTNPNSIVATLRDSTNTIKATSAPSLINVQPHSTSLTLAPASNLPWGRPTTFTVTLIDTDAGSAAISSEIISFNGTGVIGVSNVSTNTTGVAVGHGTAPSTVATSWRTQAQFAGDSSYKSSNSLVRSYSTTKHNTSLALSTTGNVPWSRPTTLTATLTDSSAGGIRVTSKTISFNGTGVIGVANVSTNGTGIAVGTGTSPSTVATGWTEQARFAGDTLYNSISSPIRAYNTIVHNTSLTLTLTPASLVHGTKYNVTGTLRDLTANVALGSGIITFTATTPITISSATTSSTGTYSVTGLIAPSSAGSYSITSQFAATSLYRAAASPARVLIVS